MNQEAIDNFKIKRGVGSNRTERTTLTLLIPEITNFSLILRFKDEEKNIYSRAYAKDEVFGRTLNYLECHDFFVGFIGKKFECEVFRCFISSVDFCSCEVKVIESEESKWIL